MERDRDPRLDRLAAQLRDEGIPPGRDLWPDIEAAIDRREGFGRQRRAPAWWRLAAAVVALVALGVAAGTFGPDGGAPRPDAAVPAYDLAQNITQPAVTGGLDALDQALGQLQESLAADPENRSLPRLVLMVHQARSDLLRKTLTSGLPVG